MILVGYDGSPNAQAAIETAGRLFPGQAAVVLTVWEEFADVMARTGGGLGLAAGWTDPGDIDAVSEKAARERAEEGAGLARRAGLSAEPRVRMRIGTIAETVLKEADESTADAVVLGSRGLTGIKSVLLGSVSHAVLVRAARPVMVVPSPEVARERAAGRHDA